MAERGGKRVDIEDVIAVYEFGKSDAVAARKQPDVYERFIDDLEFDRQMAIAWSKGDPASRKPDYWEYWKEREGLSEPATSLDTRTEEQKVLETQEQKNTIAPEEPKANDNETAPVDVQEYVAKWNDNTGEKVQVANSVEEVANTEARAAIEQGVKVKGWYDTRTGEVVVYAPNVKSAEDLVLTIVHENVSHKGLRDTLGEDIYNKMCDKTWEMMDEATRAKYESYAGVNNIKDETERHRAAADEYIASIAEKVEKEQKLTESERSIWSEVLKAIKEFIVKLYGDVKLTEQDIASIIRVSYDRMRARGDIEANSGVIETAPVVEAPKADNKVIKPSAKKVEVKAEEHKILEEQNTPKVAKAPKAKGAKKKAGEDIAKVEEAMKAEKAKRELKTKEDIEARLAEIREEYEADKEGRDIQAQADAMVELYGGYANAPKDVKAKIDAQVAKLSERRQELAAEERELEKKLATLAKVQTPTTLDTRTEGQKEDGGYSENSANGGAVEPYLKTDAELTEGEQKGIEYEIERLANGFGLKPSQLRGIEVKHNADNTAIMVATEWSEGASTARVVELIADNGTNAPDRIWQAYVDGKPASQLMVDEDVNAKDMEELFDERGFLREPTIEDFLKRRGIEFSIVDRDKAIGEARMRLEEEGVESDASGSVRFSVRYMPNDKQRKEIIDGVVAVAGVSERKAKQWLESELSLANVMTGVEGIALDYYADDRYTAIKKNSDYPQGTVDFSNICRKRKDFTAIYKQLQAENPSRVFSAEDLETIRQTMIEDGLEVACGLCYVEDRRQLMGEIADSFIKNLKEGTLKPKIQEALKGDTYVPTVAELLEPAGARTLYDAHPSVFEAFTMFNNARGMQSARLFEGYAEYKREILGWNRAKVKSVNDNGGLRIFSFSDFEATHLIDLVQVILDASSKGVMIQGYTKVPEFARAIRNTGIKLNRSLIPLGDGLKEVNGKLVLVYDPVEGIDVNDKNFLNEEDNPNVGNIVIGVNDEQIKIAMADPFIDYIIPFHSNIKKDILAKKKIGNWTNYKDSQREKNAATGRAADNGVNVYTDVLNVAEAEGKPIKNAKQFVEKFLAVCEERGLTPRFAQFLDKGKNGKYVYTKGYEKLLVDFKMFDKNGKILPQQAVKPIFDDAFNEEIIKNYVEGSKTDKNLEPTMKKLRERLNLNGTDPDKGSARFSVEEDESIKPIGKGAFGDIYNQFKGRPKEALAFFKKNKKGDLLGVFHRNGVGDIDFVWGDDKSGLSHINNKHVGKYKSFRSLDEAVDHIENIINSGKISFRDGDKIVIKKGDELVTLRRNVRKNGKKIADKNWILTAYNEESADFTSAISVVNEGQAAPTTDFSVSEVSENNSNIQENAAKSSIEDENSVGKDDYSGEGGVRFAVVEDEELINRLDADEKVIGYRNVVLNEDGTFESPMANSLRSTDRKAKEKTGGFELNKWERSEERPHLVDENGKITLVKPDGKAVEKVDYNPYIHNRLNRVNKQFKQAWERPNLVYIKTEIPLSDLESGYHAEKAKLPVGEHKWNGGNLILSRYDKPVEICDWNDVADDWQASFKKKGINFDIIPPALLPILEERGMKIIRPHKNMGDACNKAYADWAEARGIDTKGFWAEVAKEKEEAERAKAEKKAKKEVKKKAKKGEGGVRFRFIGEQGAKSMDKKEGTTARMDNLAVAKKMLSEYSYKEVKMATGWEQGMDGKWRYETPDFEQFDINGNLKFVQRHPDYARYRELVKKSKKSIDK